MCQAVILDLLVRGMEQDKILCQMVVNDGDESHGTICIKSPKTIPSYMELMV